MVTETATPDTLTTAPTTTLPTTRRTTTTHETSTTTLTTSTVSTTIPWNNTSFSTVTLVTSTSSATNSTSAPNSQGDVAIICGVIFGVLGLAIALVACYIIVRKVKENRQGSRRSLQYEDSERKPYDHVQKDMDSDHNYQPMSKNNNATTNAETSESVYGNGKPPEAPYEILKIQPQPVYSNIGVKVDDSIETNEPSTNPDRQSQIYIEMNTEAIASRQNSNVNANISATTTPGNHSKDIISEKTSYVNTKTINDENNAKQTGHSDYANSPLSLPNGQSRLSLKTDDHTKPKKHKGSKKKNKYDISNGAVADFDDITYKL